MACWTFFLATLDWWQSVLLLCKWLQSSWTTHIDTQHTDTVLQSRQSETSKKNHHTENGNHHPLFDHFPKTNTNSSYWYLCYTHIIRHICKFFRDVPHIHLSFYQFASFSSKHIHHCWWPQNYFCVKIYTSFYHFLSFSIIFSCSCSCCSCFNRHLIQQQLSLIFYLTEHTLGKITHPSVLFLSQQLCLKFWLIVLFLRLFEVFFLSHIFLAFQL